MITDEVKAQPLPMGQPMVMHGKLVEACEIAIGDSFLAFGEVYTRQPHPAGPSYDNIYVHCVNQDQSKSTNINKHAYVNPVKWAPPEEEVSKGSGKVGGVTCRILRDGPTTKIAEFVVRGRRYGINADYLKDEEHEQWFLRTVSGILTEVDTQAAEATQHSMQDKLRGLLGLTVCGYGPSVKFTGNLL